MKMGIVRLCAAALLAAVTVSSLGCASVEKWGNDQLNRAFASKLTKLGLDRDEASENVQERITQLRADEMSLGVQEGTPAWFENRRVEGQTILDEFAPVIADYKAYRDSLVSKSNRTPEESQTMLQVTADLAQTYQRVIDFNGAWKLIQASAAEKGIAGLNLTAPAGSEYLLELEEVNGAPGFATVNLAQLPGPSNPTLGNDNYVRSGVDGVNRTNAEINSAQGRFQEAQRTWQTITNFGK